MSEVSESIERLINRRLDGELSDAERVTLDSELLASSEARRMLQDYERIDRYSLETLRSALTSQHPEYRRSRTESPYRLWWYLPTAVAAGLAIFLWWSTPSAPLGTGREFSARPTPLAVSPFHQPAPVMTPAFHGIGLEDQALDRNAVWIVGDDGRIYLIERHVSQVLKRPPRDSLMWNTAGGV